MNNKDIEALRETIKSKLAEIANIADSINESMVSRPHERGATHLSLKPKSGMYIDDMKTGFVARYQGQNGSWYDINISKRIK